nr:MAG TPA: hypothetical protein [Caudoviricetes sp.]
MTRRNRDNPTGPLEPDGRDTYTPPAKKRKGRRKPRWNVAQHNNKR